MSSIKRISFQEGVDLYNNADILELGRMADDIRKKKHQENIVTFVTNVVNKVWHQALKT